MGHNLPTPSLSNIKRYWSFKIHVEIKVLNGVKLF